MPPSATSQSVHIASLLFYFSGYTLLILQNGGWHHYMNVWTKFYFQMGSLAALAFTVLTFLSIRWFREKSYEVSFGSFFPSKYILTIVTSSVVRGRSYYLRHRMPHLRFLPYQTSQSFWPTGRLYLLRLCLGYFLVLRSDYQTFQDTLPQFQLQSERYFRFARWNGVVPARH